MRFRRFDSVVERGATVSDASLHRGLGFAIAQLGGGLSASISAGAPDGVPCVGAAAGALADRGWPLRGLVAALLTNLIDGWHRAVE